MKKKKIFTIICIVVAAFAIFLIVGGIIRKTSFKSGVLGQSDYDTVFFVQFDSTNFSSDSFTNYLAENVCICHEENLNKIGQKAKWTIEKTGTQKIYMGLDPYNCNYGKKAGKALGRKMNSKFFDVIKRNPDVEFDIMLFSPNADYWFFNSPVVNEEIDSYSALVDSLDIYENVHFYFPGYEEWVLINPGIMENGAIVADIADLMVASCFADRDYEMNSANQWDKLDRIDLVGFEEIYKSYPNYDNMKITYFGDSIIGNNKGTDSIPKLMENLTGAEGENLAVGGTTGAKDFPEAVKKYLDENRVKDSRKQVYVINYGINDFFNGIDPKGDKGSYEAGLKEGIELLKENTEGDIWVCTPTYIDAADVNISLYEEYVAVAEKVAKTQGCMLLDNYSTIDITAYNSSRFLADGTHLNGNGRVRYVRNLIELFRKEYGN